MVTRYTKWHMYEAVLSEVLQAYGIRPRKIHAHQKGYRNEIWPVELADGTYINVTFFKREDESLRRIRRADAVSEYLADHGLPTRRRVDPRRLQLKNDRLTTLVGVYVYLPGTTIPWEAYTMNHIKLLGKAMSDMHALLAEMPDDTTLPSVYDEYAAILRRMKRYFHDPQVRAAMQQKLGVELDAERTDEFSRLLDDIRQQPDQQALHMDFVRGNILFGAPSTPELTLGAITLSGILDFEKTAFGHPVMDIARTLAFLLVDCKYKTPEKVHKYFLESGYKKRGAAKSFPDVTLLEESSTMFLLYDFYKFLRHNPYESLADNEHYVRTRDILHERNMVRYL